MDPTMISVEAELQAVERDFYSGKCGAFETADAQHAVTDQLTKLKQLENELFAQSRALWEWSPEEQGLWQNAMHRQGGNNNNNNSHQTPSQTPSPGAQQQHQMSGADQLASLFAKRDLALKEVSKTVSSLTQSISNCCEVVSRGGGGGSMSNNNNNTVNGATSSVSAANAAGMMGNTTTTIQINSNSTLKQQQAPPPTTNSSKRNTSPSTRTTNPKSNTVG